MSTLTLYSTDGCSACEIALEMLFAMPELHGFGLNVIDVASSHDLIDTYGPRIPVLVYAASGNDKAHHQELNAPFDQAQVRAWLQQFA